MLVFGDVFNVMSWSRSIGWLFRVQMPRSTNWRKENRTRNGGPPPCRIEEQNAVPTHGQKVHSRGRRARAEVHKCGSTRGHHRHAVLLAPPPPVCSGHPRSSRHHIASQAARDAVSVASVNPIAPKESTRGWIAMSRGGIGGLWVSDLGPLTDVREVMCRGDI